MVEYDADSFKLLPIYTSTAGDSTVDFYYFIDVEVGCLLAKHWQVPALEQQAAAALPDADAASPRSLEDLDLSPEGDSGSSLVQSPPVGRVPTPTAAIEVPAANDPAEPEATEAELAAKEAEILQQLENIDGSQQHFQPGANVYANDKKNTGVYEAKVTAVEFGKLPDFRGEWAYHIHFLGWK